MNRKTLSIALSVAVLATACTLVGSAASDKVPPINADRAGLALHGYDPVSYFDGSPRPGQASIESVWNGATWRFASAENRDRFVAEPERYAPQFGGYCAKAVSENHTADVDPLAYKVVNGKLYLNYSPKVQKLWEEDIPGRIARGEQNWPGLKQPS